MFKVGDKVTILSTPYQGLHDVGSEQTITEVILNVPYGVFINGYPYANAEVELIHEEG